jgi:hypothetical protein
VAAGPEIAHTGNYGPLVGIDAEIKSAAARDASIFKMMDVSRHRSVDTLRGYIRDAELFRDHAGAGLL